MATPVRTRTDLVLVPLVRTGESVKQGMALINGMNFLRKWRARSSVFKIDLKYPRLFWDE